MLYQNMEHYKGREMVEGQLVEVYRNLRNGRWSVRDAKTKLVLAHCNHAALKDVEFVVSETLRQRVIREKRKNVHAVLRGTIIHVADLPIHEPMREAYDLDYNPYECGSFVHKYTREPKSGADYVTLSMTGGPRVTAIDLEKGGETV